MQNFTLPTLFTCVGENHYICVKPASEGAAHIKFPSIDESVSVGVEDFKCENDKNLGVRKIFVAFFSNLLVVSSSMLHKPPLAYPNLYSWVSSGKLRQVSKRKKKAWEKRKDDIIGSAASILIL